MTPKQTDDAANIVPFGKYRGQPVEAMMADRDYCAWALAQPGLRTRFAGLFAVIVNGGVAPDAPTPEHNRMQLLFRDPEMRVAAYRAIVGEKAINERSERWLNDSDPVFTAGVAGMVAALDAEIASGTFKPIQPFQRSGFRSMASYDSGFRDWPEALAALFSWRAGAVWSSAEAMRDACGRVENARLAARALRQKEMLETGDASRLLDEAIRKAPVEFEVYGWDVAIDAPSGGGCFPGVDIELKPQVGDDYPVVLRTMKMRTVHSASSESPSPPYLLCILSAAVASSK